MKHRLLAAAAGVMAWSAVAHAADFAIVADPSLTPGAVRTTDATEICSRDTRESCATGRATATTGSWPSTVCRPGRIQTSRSTI